MVLHIDLIRKFPRNIFRIAMGSLLLAAVAYFIIRKEAFFSSTQLIIFGIAGVYYLAMGFGFNPLTFWAKAYIHIDSTIVKIKASMFAKAEQFQWSNIKEVQIKVTSIRFLFNQGEPHEMDYQKLDDDLISQLKESVISFCKEKDIKLG